LTASDNRSSEPVWIWGIPFAPLTLVETVDHVAALIEKNQPAFFITANTHYVMLTHEHPDLFEVNAQAAFIVADGAPLVWAAGRRAVSLPERVAGSDLIFALCDLAARSGYRLFLAGGAPGVAEAAASQLCDRYPGLTIVGTAAPYFDRFDQSAYQQLKAQIQDSRPEILIVAASMPHGERWLAAHLADLGVPVGVNLGASIDFAAGRVQRAPRWMQRSGLEWAFRLWLEPSRLFGRYARNARFLLRMTLRDLAGRPVPDEGSTQAVHPTGYSVRADQDSRATRGGTSASASPGIEDEHRTGS
jgi:N-acetylglucosaminyldiphosphoundecaprenol N-acetyl-beta-D-mannosaminyltransferase